MIAEIDKKSGFCFGVIRAIDAAEAELIKADADLAKTIFISLNLSMNK